MNKKSCFLPLLPAFNISITAYQPVWKQRIKACALAQGSRIYIGSVKWASFPYCTVRYWTRPNGNASQAARTKSENLTFPRRRTGETTWTGRWSVSWRRRAQQEGLWRWTRSPGKAEKYGLWDDQRRFLKWPILAFIRLKVPLGFSSRTAFLVYIIKHRVSVNDITTRVKNKFCLLYMHRTMQQFISGIVLVL